VGGVFDTIYLDILPGEGGEDSRLFANDLADVYLKHAARNNIKAKITQSNKHQITLELHGKKVLHYF
jgi:protein subunit release factor A